MAGLTVSKDTEAVHNPRDFESSWNSTLWLVVGSVAAMLILQAWLSSHLVSRTSNLRNSLSAAHSVASKFERRVGYGGLIHDFKNYVLRPNEDNYRTSALDNSAEALVLLDSLSTNAKNLGIDMSLVHTREMVQSYTRLLEQVRKLSASGLSSQLIDQQVRFDDSSALLEVDLILAALDEAGNDRLEQLQHQETVSSLLSTAGAATLGVLLISIFVRRQRRHTESLAVIAERLSATNQDLSKANTSLNQFAGIVSHDLKSPIRYIHVFNQMIAGDAGNASSVKQHVDLSNQQIQQMDSIIDSLLDFTQVGFSQLHTDEIDVTTLFAAVECDLQAEIDQHGAHVEFTSNLDMPVLADFKLVSRVFANLVGNSLKYASADEPACITVNAENKDGYAQFSVIDNGIGIEAQFADKIFEPMMRLHGPQSSYNGVGIGLSLVKTIVESHGGLIWLDTEFTQGTRIVFSLPLTSYTEKRKAA